MILKFYQWFFPYQEQATLKYSLTVPDVHWLSLRPELEGYIFPSKFYGIAAAGRPIVALAADNGEMAGLIRKHDCGFAIDPSNAGRLALAIRDLATDPRRCADMGRRARAMLDANFTRAAALAQWRAVLDRAG